MMRFLAMRRAARIFLIALAWWLWPAAAQAQAFPCSGGSNGAGPGERMVGMSPSGPGMAPFPLCVRDDSGGAPRQPAAPSNSYAAPSNSYAAIAWHPDAADIWVDGNYVGPGVAERGALDACNKVMGGGCSSTGEWWNSSMTVIRNKEGYFSNGWNGDGEAQRRQALADCSAGQLLPCEVFATIRSSTNRRSPGASARKYFAASAWVDGGAADGYNATLYVASGYRSADAASAAAIKACADATSRKCEMNALTGNGFIQAYRLIGSGESATAETSAKRAKEAAQANCKKRGVTCELQAQFDARKPGIFVHEFVRPGAP